LKRAVNIVKDDILIASDHRYVEDCQILLDIQVCKRARTHWEAKLNMSDDSAEKLLGDARSSTYRTCACKQLYYSRGRHAIHFTVGQLTR
jgi:hypothetical protein